MIIQMSAGYWPKQVAKVLNQTLGFKHELIHMDDDQIEDYLVKAIRQVPLEEFIGLSENFTQNAVREEAGQYNLFDENGC